MPAEMPAHIVAMFNHNPRAHLALVEMGHGYGKAKFSGSCKVTGLPIIIGQTIRKLSFWSRDGRFFEGYVPGATCSLLQFVGGGEFMTEGGPVTPATSTWRLWSPSWLEGVDLASMPVGTSFEVMKVNAGAYAETINRWVLDERGGVRAWVQNYNRSSDAQLAAALKRTKKAVAFRIELPYR